MCEIVTTTGSKRTVAIKSHLLCNRVFLYMISMTKDLRAYSPTLKLYKIGTKFGIIIH